MIKNKFGYYCHENAIVDEGAAIGRETRVWGWTHVLAGANIGADCNICENVFIENDVVLGDKVTVKCGVYIWDGISIGDFAFIGPGVTFVNDIFPRSKNFPDKFLRTTVGRGASIGANATVLPVSIGENAMIGAGAVVTKNVPANAIVIGNPARIIGYIDTEMISPTVKNTNSNISSVSGAKLLDIPSFSDMRGDLSVLELEKTLPFSIHRLFYTYNVDTTMVRGEHAHKKCQQFLIAVSGSLNVICDNGTVREEFKLDSPSTGLLIPSGCWGIQYKHSMDCVLLVCASHKYDANDYIRNYNEFLEYKKTNK